MSTNQLSEQTVRVHARNIGGIDEAEVTLPPGVSVLTGRNATNRTSFLQAIMAGLGSERASLKGNAEEGSVTLEVGGETYTRTLRRAGGTVSYEGDPYLGDPELADLFAFLLENNDARQAVSRGDDLREIIMKPIDTDRIDAEIEQCKRRRSELESEIERLDELERDLPELETKRTEKESELAEARDELESIESELAELDSGVEESRSRKQELEDAFQRVRDARSELEDLEFDLETERTTLSELRSERDELEATLADADDPEEDPEWLAGRIEELRGRKRSLDERSNDLGSVIGFNEEMLDGDGLDINDSDYSDPTEELTASGETVCWTCGSEVEESQIEATIQSLRDLRTDILDERKEVRSTIDELTTKRTEVRKQRNEQERAERRITEVEAEIETTESRIDGIESDIEATEDRVAELEAKTEEIDVEGHDEVLDLHRRLNGKELRIEQLESELDRINDEIAEREAAVEERDELQSERDELADRLTELRTRVDRIEKDAVEAFNDHMETVLQILEYDNLDRVWIDRRETEVREGRRKVTRTRFDLHIVRSGADGSAYEDTVDHLSESEREVTGLVFALAGYLVHDVHEVVPFVVLDSLEAIDSDRIARVVDYFCDHVDHLVAALLPEDAAALSEEYTYIEHLG
ncbi:archaea-specific SMC-related protein [Halorubrum sp. DTA98]|uniref:archaea-specific SMC-related protein n=1 Tax=Halorubrum sp. DTA98 TaxID=3402163 RepID=UPI003AB0A0B4